MKTPFRLTCLSFLLSLGPLAAADLHPVVALELGVSEGNPRNTEGDFVALKDGGFLYVYTRFRGGGSDHDRADLVSRISRDGGKTWSAEDQPVVGNEGGLNVMSVSLLRLHDGRIALFYLQKNSLTDCRPVVRFSTDEAATWSEPTSIIPDAEIGYYVLNNDRVVQLGDGRLLAPVAKHHQPGQEKADWNGAVGCYFSDDGGNTWQSPKQLDQAFDSAGKRVAAQEPGVVELQDGRVLLWVRTGAGEFYRAHSGDRGQTWTPLVPMGVATPQSPASLERLPESGELVLVWNDHSDLPVAERKLRTPLSVAVSTDEGESWSAGHIIEPDPMGWYCYTAIECTDEHLLLAYVAGTQAPGKRLSVSRITRIPLTELRALNPTAK
ncbi:MAG: exo-alpha-sialidase [Verrucomicrobiaceae bacterium]|nr:exo-alpha-sialidase [Verrucomicrobiaceae bacterium]